MPRSLRTCITPSYKKEVMKKIRIPQILLLSGLLLAALESCTEEKPYEMAFGTATGKLVIHLNRGGSLGEAIEKMSEDPADIASLVLTGNLTQTDMGAMNRLVGLANDLEEVDLGGAHLLEGCMQPGALSGLGTVRKITFPATAYTGERLFNTINDLLEEVVIPEGVKCLGKSALSTVRRKFTRLSLPASLKRIEDAAFDMCESLPSVSIPDGVDSIGSYVFRSCFSFREFTLPARFTSVPAGLLADCKNLETFRMGSGVTEIGDNAFAGCNKLRPFPLPPQLEVIGSYTFNSPLWREVNLPGTVRRIRSYAFGFSRIENIRLPEGVTTLDASALATANGLLRELYIPGTVTSMGETVVGRNPELTCVTIGPGLAKMGVYMFPECPKLRELHIQCTTPPTAEFTFDKAVYGAGQPDEKVIIPGLDKSLVTLYVPQGSKAHYLADKNWRGFARIVEEKVTPTVN